MQGLRVVGKRLPKVTDFYADKSVFVTGASGFVGSVLLENLLRCCPGIKSVFILLRSKKDVTLEDRKTKIFNKKIFERIKDENRELLDKVHLIAGDVSFPNLGMKEEDSQLLTEEVSTIFHCASSINFMKPLKSTLLNNVSSLNSIIELSRRMRKFEGLVYTSTAYSNCNSTNVIIKEEVQRLPFRAENFLDALKNEDYEKLQELYARCKPDWPNSYTFSKCLAENVIVDTASDLPIAIIRPSIIVSSWKHPMPGYDEGHTAQAAYFIGIGRGFVKVIYLDPNCKVDLVPVDIVAKSHILAACSIGTKRCASPLIVNCTAPEKLRITCSEYTKIATQVGLKFPYPQSFKTPTNCIILPYKYPYYIATAYHHYLPAIVLDVMLAIIGKKPWIYSTYRFIDTVLKSASFFGFQSFEFERNNLEYLDKLIHPEDRKDLSLDFREATFQEILFKIPEASPFYDWKRDKESPLERQKTKYRVSFIVNCIQGTFIVSSICCFIACFH